jgi:hypothetical protein
VLFTTPIWAGEQPPFHGAPLEGKNLQTALDPARKQGLNRLRKNG